MNTSEGCTITELADDVFRIGVRLGASGEVACFVIRGDEPAMVEVGLGKTFEIVSDAVSQLVDVTKLRYLFIPYFAMDECGALNQFAARAPQSQAVCSPPGAIAYLDYCGRMPHVLRDGERLHVGAKTIVGVSAPWVPAYDSMLFLDETDGVLFSSDLFIQPPRDELVTDLDLSAGMVDFYRDLGALPSRALLDHLLSKLQQYDVKVLAPMHGPSLTGDPSRYYRALRDHPVTDLVDAAQYQRLFDVGLS